MTEKFKYKFPLGDWSGDGHSYCEWFFVTGDKPIEDVREAHFKCEEVFGVGPGKICNNYGESTLNEDVKSILIKHFPEIKNNISEDIVLDIWVRMLNKVDDTLNLEIIKIDDTIPSINFYGFDTQGRHLEVPGYGLFGD